LLNGGSGALIAITGGRVTPVNLEDLRDPQSGRIRVRMVDVATESFEVARSYMIRLELSDLQEPERSKLASRTNLSAEAFEQRFLGAVKATTPSP
jgi:6-phosphofructokinase 1